MHLINRNKNNLPVMLLSASIPIMIMVLVYYQKGIYPGGVNTILVMDMQAQYMPFYASLKYVFNGDNSIFFSASGALGVNYWGNFAYYLTSPLTWIASTVSLEKLPDAIYIITLIRFGLAGFSFCCYLIVISNERIHKYGIFLLSCCYALMSYNVAYALNLMWLDTVIMLPWILIGVEEVLKDKSASLLVFSIFISLCLNYYITYMSAVFTVFYTAIRLTELGKWESKRVTRLLLSGVLGAGMAMPIILPGVMAMSNGKMNEGNYEIKGYFRYSLFDVFKQLLSGKYDSVYDDGLPFIFCGTCTLLLVFIYVVLVKDNLVTKSMYMALICLYLFSMCFVPLDRFMHGMRETTCFEVRYGFVFSFLLLMLAYRGIPILTDILQKYKILNAVRAIAVLFVLIELYMNSSICISGLMVESHYKTKREYDMELASKQHLINLIEDKDFYRISDTHGYTHNDGAWLGYNGFGYFSSNYNLSLMNYLGALGEDQIFHDLANTRRTQLEEVLFGAKYRIEYLANGRSGHVLGADGMYTLYENDDALSLGYMVEDESKNTEISSNAFENLNSLAKELSGIDTDVFAEINPDRYESIKSEGYSREVIANYDVPEDSAVWAYFEWASLAERKEKNVTISDPTDPHFNGGIKEIKLYVNGEDVGPFLDDHSSFMIYLGDYKEGDLIELDARSQVYFGELHVAYIDSKAYKTVIDELSKEQLDIVEHGNGTVKGIINASRDGTLLITFPYMNGWRASIDGRKVDLKSYKEVFVAIPISKGEHTVELKYVSPGIGLGVGIGILSFMVTCAWLFFIYNRMGKSGLC